MNFRNLSYWLKGGIIAGILFTFLLIIFLFIPSIGCNNNEPLPEGQLYEKCAPIKISQFLLLPIYFILDILEIGNDYLALSFAFLFSLIMYFLIGALIGWIYEKIKSKKTS